MKKVNYFTILAIATIVLYMIIPSFGTKTITGTLEIGIVFCLVEIAFSIGSIIYAKKNEKSKVAGIILLVVGLLAISLFGIFSFALKTMQDPEKNGELCKELIQCEAGNGDTSTCYINGDTSKLLPFECKNSNLTDEQFEK
jgi:Na+/H+-translocating membrane pyrophosphatase